MRRSPRVSVARPETQLHRAVVDYLRLAKPAALWFHVPNGGARTRTEAAIFQGLGVRAGAPDLVFLAGSFSGGIELKAPGGQLSAVQVRFAEECSALGVRYAVCTSVAEVHRVLYGWGVLDGRVSVIGS